MLLRDFKDYTDIAKDDEEVGVVVYSIDTGNEIAATFDVVADINEYGQLMINIEI
jgi:hypothetical protein